MACPDTTSTIEEWRAVPGFEGYYEVSNLGRVRSVLRVVARNDGRTTTIQSRIMGLHNNGRGYIAASLSRDNKARMHYVHRLVLMAFVGNPEEGQEANHIDFDRSNNRLSNLEWVTGLENVHHSRRAGRTGEGERHHAARLTETDVREARLLYANGWSQSKLAAKYGIRRESMRDIVNRKVWRMVA